MYKQNVAHSRVILDRGTKKKCDEHQFSGLYGSVTRDAHPRIVFTSPLSLSIEAINKPSTKNAKIKSCLFASRTKFTVFQYQLICRGKWIFSNGRQKSTSYDWWSLNREKTVDERSNSSFVPSSVIRTIVHCLGVSLIQWMLKFGRPWWFDDFSNKFCSHSIKWNVKSIETQNRLASRSVFLYSHGIQTKQ